jgi:hypothetical protein
MNLDVRVAEIANGGARARVASSKAEVAPKADGKIAVFLFTLLVSIGLAWAWYRHGDNIIVPKTGWGYALGIVGALMMLSLLLYPMRKRIKFMRSWGDAANWFRWHMILGIIGPALILVHSNFQTASANATVALAAMLVVASSGIAGRYLYGRVHAGLYGHKLEARTMRDEAIGARATIGGNLAGLRDWKRTLADFEADALAPTPSLISALFRAVTIGGAIRKCRKEVGLQLDLDLERAARTNMWGPADLAYRQREERQRLNLYFASISRAATLGIYERLFGLWHVLHVPLFVMLVITAIIHVIAVHLY